MASESAEPHEPSIELQLRRMNRALRLVSDCNNAVIHASDEQLLYERVCRIATDAGGYRAAWVGLARDDSDRSVEMVADVGVTAGCNWNPRVTWADTERGRGPAGTAIRTCRPVVITDLAGDPCFAPWRKEAQRQGWTACAALPLVDGDRAMGALVIYSDDPLAFGGEELSLLVQLAGDLAFGVRGLRTSAALREKDARLVALLENTPDLIWSVDSDYKLTMANASFRRQLLPATTHEIRDGESVLSPFPARLAAEWEALYDRALEGEAFLHETFTPAPDGTPEYRENSFNPIRGPDGVPTGVSCFSRDVTSQMKAQEKLRRSEQRFRSIVEAAPFGILLYRLEENGRLVLIRANPTAERILGVDRSAAIGMTIEQALPSLAATEVPERFRRAAASGERWHTDELIYEDARVKGVFKVHAFQTGPSRMAAVFLDITDRARAEEERRKLEAQLHHSQKMEAVGRLAGGIAHDFNNLLTVIISYAQFIQEALSLRDPMREDAEEIGKAAKRAKELTRQLLAFGRKSILVLRPLSLNDILQPLEKMLERIVGEDIDIRFDFGRDLAAVRADASQVEQVVANLVVNARDAMPEGGKLTIETRNVFLDEERSREHLSTPPGEWVMLAVTDTGTGMTEEVRQHLFEPFFTTKKPGVGTGLGLATVYGIVKQLGGHISVCSEPGHGSTFRIYLPRTETAPGQEAVATRREPLRRAAARVLLVEDEDAVRAIAKRLLEQQGYVVVDAKHAGDALLLVESQDVKVDAVLTDVVLPGMSGKVLVDRLRQKWPTLPVVFMSGYADNAIAHRGILDEGVLFVQKPFERDQLLARLQEALSSEHQERDPRGT